MTRKEEIEKGIKYFKNNKNRLLSLYKEMYGESICINCPGSVEYAYEKMYRDREKKFTSYAMKRGCVINTHLLEIEGIPKGHFTIHNMTDELARLLIENGFADKFIL